MRSKYDPYFTRDGKKWFCMRCPFEIVPKDSSTTSLSHHLRTKHPEQWNELDASNSQNNLNKSKKRPNSTTVDVWVSPTPSPLIANYVNSNSSSGSQPPPPKQMRLEDF
uniref:BED-type domain-containing protein n=1 Tax=Panagrolaimus sp. JU765 TaxID=591449 RepID=A0AC34Q5N7_9BILA